MRRLIVLVFVLFAVPAFAQMQETVHVDAYSSRSVAAAAIGGYINAGNVALIPTRIESSFFGTPRAVYAIVYQPVVDVGELCSTSSGSSPRPITSYTDACGNLHTLEGWVVASFNTSTNQRNWYNNHLSDLQRGSAFMLTDPTDVNNPYLVGYRTELPYNYHCP